MSESQRWTLTRRLIEDRRARLRQAHRLFARTASSLSREEFMTIEGGDLRTGRVFG